MHAHTCVCLSSTREPFPIRNGHAGGGAGKRGGWVAPACGACYPHVAPVAAAAAAACLTATPAKAIERTGPSLGVGTGEEWDSIRALGGSGWWPE